MQINNYIRAGYPGLCIKTTEEVRALTDLHATASQMAYTFATWDTSGAFRTWVGAPLESPTETKDADGPAEALSLICGLPEKAIVALPDMDLLLSDDGKRTPNPQLIRLMKTTLENAELTQKTIATLMGCPLVKLDMGRVYGSLVGESEASIRRCIEVAEAIAPCVLWIDELEKAASGSASSGRTDGGTGSRVLATLLTWLNDKTSSVFVVATANDVTALPPELMRKGRFDEQWFVDLPNPDERKTILEIHIRKRGHAIPAQLHQAALATEGFVGAELEALVVEALFNAFDESKPLELKHIVHAAHATKPMATMLKEQIDALRKWADGRARPASSAPAATPERVRKLDVGGKN